MITYNKCKNGTRFIKSGKNTLGWIKILDINQPGCFIDYFYIKPKYQNKGFGWLVLQDLFVECKSLGTEGISLFVNIKNDGAIRLYKKLGFFIGYTIKKKEGVFYCMCKPLTNN